MCDPEEVSDQGRHGVFNMRIRFLQPSVRLLPNTLVVNLACKSAFPTVDHTHGRLSRNLGLGRDKMWRDSLGPQSLVTGI